jgi:hypothetical protein
MLRLATSSFCHGAAARAAPAPACTASPAALSTARRALTIGKTTFSRKLHRRGQRTFPHWRHPSQHQRHATNITAPYHWHYFGPKHHDKLLPKENYVTGDWTGLYYMNRIQVYTLQHTTATAKVRIRRFPTFFDFKQQSRWMIGKALRTWVEPKAHIIDEASLTKKQRMVLIKKGLLDK